MAQPLAPLLIALECWGDEASGTESEGSINLRGDRGRGREGEQAGQTALHDVIMRASKASAKQRLVVFNKTTQITACQGDKMLEAKSLYFVQSIHNL